jgi:glycosyltransferase involved in cell wall biosynthesis
MRATSTWTIGQARNSTARPIVEPMHAPLERAEDRQGALLASVDVTPPPEISVVIPCLDEEQAVGKVVDQALEGIRLSGRTGEVLVVDNGSTDTSAQVAAEHGAIVVSEPRRGYGSAYLAGLEAARGDYVVMGDADDTYPLSELPGFVDRLESGDDLVIGSRFNGTIHGDAMPFLNRFVGNPVLTGMLNVLFGVKVSDAHCGMRAVRREALSTLDLHSTGMEFASEMVFKAYRRGLTVSEVPIDYYPRIGESKLNRFGDAWRHVRFMLLYSPSWLYLVPGGLLLVLGLVGMIGLALGPIDVFGRTWQIHTMLGFVALTLIGAQVIQLGVFARTYARVRIGERDLLLERLGRGVTLERGLLAGGALVLFSFVGLVLVGAEWAASGFGELGRAYETALLVTGLGLGIQIVFGAFFLALLTMPLRRESTAPTA